MTRVEFKKLVDDTLAGLIVTLPSLAIVLSAGLMGLLIDRWDRQKLLLLTAALYAVGGTSGLWAESIWAMLAGRLAAAQSPR